MGNFKYTTSVWFWKELVRIHLLWSYLYRISAFYVFEITVTFSLDFSLGQKVKCNEGAYVVIDWYDMIWQV